MVVDEAWQRAREDVLRTCRRMQAERLVHATAGNVSVRIPGDRTRIAMTPAALPYDVLEPDDICIVSVDGQAIDGRRAPTSELPLHTLVYRRRPEVGAIIHTHSPAAMTMAALGWTLPPILTGLVEATGGSVRTARFSRPGTAEMADLTAEALADRGACFLRHHGLLAVGADLPHAWRAASVTEVSADVCLRARVFGPVPELPEEEVRLIVGAWRSQWVSREAPTGR